MKVKITQPYKLIDEGKDNWERTDEFNMKVNEIRRELLAKYSPVLWTKKIGSSDKSSRFVFGLK